jgi:hypothetical protein
VHRSEQEIFHAQTKDSSSEDEEEASGASPRTGEEEQSSAQRAQANSLIPSRAEALSKMVGGGDAQ